LQHFSVINAPTIRGKWTIKTNVADGYLERTVGGTAVVYVTATVDGDDREGWLGVVLGGRQGGLRETDGVPPGGV
jgi:hypothetical protein